MTAKVPWLLVVGILSSYPAGSQSAFRDATATSGIAGTDRTRGVSICDYNADGLPDIYVCNLDAPNQLYRNNGGGTFEEVAHGKPLAEAGPSMTALWADLDNDGDQDVIIGNKDEPSRLFAGAGTETFDDVTITSGIDLSDKVQAGLIFDYDSDGLLDVYLTVLNAPNQLYRNLGALQFEEVGGAAGAAITGLAMGAIAFDYDLDGDQDLYLVHDGSQPNVLLRNDGGSFTDVSERSGTDVVGDGMGVDAADYDGDGDFDIYVTNLYENYLLENDGAGGFREVGFDARVNDLGMGWGTAFIDYDIDGRPDIYVANETGFSVGGQRYNNVLYRNEGSKFSRGVPPEAPICSDRSGYGAAVADFNADGLPDLFIGNSGQENQLFINTSPSFAHHWLDLELVGTTINRDAIGARARVYSGDDVYTAEVRAGGSFASQHSRSLPFGLGKNEGIDSLVVYWSATESEVIYLSEVDRSYRIVEGEGIVSSVEHASGIRPFSVFPNPVRDRVQLGRVMTGLRLFDGYGREVYAATGPTEWLDLPAELPAGLYTLIGREDNRRYRAKFIRY